MKQYPCGCEINGTFENTDGVCGNNMKVCDKHFRVLLQSGIGSGEARGAE